MRACEENVQILSEEDYSSPVLILFYCVLSYWLLIEKKKNGAPNDHILTSYRKESVPGSYKIRIDLSSDHIMVGEYKSKTSEHGKRKKKNHLFLLFV